MNLATLVSIINTRKAAMPKNSYIADLFREGSDRIAQKVGEEAIEVVLASKNQSKKRLVEELADLWFHTLILMATKNISLFDLFREFKKRHKTATIRP